MFFAYRLYNMSYTNKFFTTFTKKFISIALFFVGFLMLLAVYYFYKILSGFA
jgi:hypothetical protein